VIHELKAQVLLEGDFAESFTTGSNKQIVATETQKNTLYVLAKKYPLDSIEEWAVLVAKDFMSRYNHISAVNMDIDEYLWDRIVVQGQEHNHAFQKSQSGIRYTSVRVPRRGTLTITSGVRDLQVMKTTQSGFEGFIRDQYTTLPETRDRILCTKVQCSWVFRDLEANWGSLKSQFTPIFEQVKEIVLSCFGGDPKTGTYSPSVQQTIYQTGQKIVEKFSSIDKVSFVLPNIHYYYVDFKQFKSELENKGEVFFTFDGAAGHIEGTVERQAKSKL
jgi:urate oxidase